MQQAKGKKIYSVSEVNYFAKQTLEEMNVWVNGEVSSLKKNPNWSFYYLDLKDDYALLPCIVSGYLIENLGEEIQGQKVTAFGNLSLYEPLGKYQLRIQSIELTGEGDLAKKLETLIKKLKAEGLFEQRHKKQLPKYPKKVCIVTSEGSDAWNDFKRHTVDQFPIIELYTADVRVQGPQAVPSLIEVLPKVDEYGFDVIVITRGGGSLEDLAAFNDEQVARTIFTMKTPTVVAIGHEANESLAEWVADRRASTPTDAAHIITAEYQNLLTKLENFQYQLSSRSAYYFTTNLQRMDYIYLKLQQTKLSFKELPHRLNSYRELLRRHEKYLIADAEEKLAALLKELKKETVQKLQEKNQTLQNLNKSLNLLSPTNTLSRGYSITTDQAGNVIRSVASVQIGSTIGVKLADGQFKSQVKSKSRNV